MATRKRRKKPEILRHTPENVIEMVQVMKDALSAWHTGKGRPLMEGALVMDAVSKLGMDFILFKGNAERHAQMLFWLCCRLSARAKEAGIDLERTRELAMEQLPVIDEGENPTWH